MHSFFVVVNMGLSIEHGSFHLHCWPTQRRRDRHNVAPLLTDGVVFAAVHHVAGFPNAPARKYLPANTAKTLLPG